jgi:hypothetical protein
VARKLVLRHILVIHWATWPGMLKVYAKVIARALMSRMGGGIHFLVSVLVPLAGIFVRLRTWL